LSFRSSTHRKINDWLTENKLSEVSGKNMPFMVV
jgi:hypothetical protein